MASLAYITVPASATRLQGDPTSPTIQRAKRVLTSLPSPSPASSPAPGSNARTSSSSASIPTSLTSPTTAAFSLLPQMLLSSTFQPSSLGPKEKDKNSTGSSNAPLLLTTRDPLSLPTTSANFKRFVAKAGPIFWFQDRVEEVVMWRRGWRVTGVWMAIYAFFCYFPKMVFAIPHVVLIGIMLASYPYPDASSPTSTTTSTSASPPTPSSESVNWQGNLQAIQNLMGLVADIHDLIQPHTHLLLLSPAHISSANSTPSTHPPSPYPPYILLALLLSFPPLIFLLSSPFFPTRIVCLVAGLVPLFATHPRVRPFFLPLSHLVSASSMELCQKGITILTQRYKQIRHAYMRLSSRLGLLRTQTEFTNEKGLDEVMLFPLQTILERLRDDDKLDDVCWRAEMREVELWENERYARSRVGAGEMRKTFSFCATSSPRTSIDSSFSAPAYPDGHGVDVNNISGLPTRSSSDTPDPAIMSKSTSDAMTDFHRPSTISLPAHSSILTHLVPHPADAGWSKANLRPGERRAWTRGRDGWGGILPRTRAGSDGHGVPEKKEREREGAERREEGQEAEGVVSSNLTFSLAPGWAFVRTEGWRRDRTRAWASLDFVSPHSMSASAAASTVLAGTDMSGWVYTNDVWGEAHPAPYPGSVTRRRRWVRRVWFDGSGKGVTRA
ncbi:hypothetical protein D9615_006804 [Tricholomella constricta]|uniref:Peroxin/Ferlin domain-containing protein n=1 Tax=Tricholomella constricta TaxID=117010 RepID=A0A8H5M272_9AGAR|nr:hypothetical protein D9615_006804 [Tricholomella constricta]